MLFSICSSQPLLFLVSSPLLLQQDHLSAKYFQYLCVLKFLSYNAKNVTLETPPCNYMCRELMCTKQLEGLSVRVRVCRCVCVCVYRIHTLTIRSCVPSEEMTVPLSPTSEGRVWDIQFVTIAMVLSTAPIFNMGTLILTYAHPHTHTQATKHTHKLWLVLTRSPNSWLKQRACTTLL